MRDNTKLINFYKEGYWEMETILNILSKVKSYTDKKGLKDVELVEIEDSSLCDTENQRFDVVIQCVTPKGLTIQKKLLILKGEVVDGEEFHKRFKEFYKPWRERKYGLQ